MNNVDFGGANDYSKFRSDDIKRMYEIWNTNIGGRWSIACEHFEIIIRVNVRKLPANPIIFVEGTDRKTTIIYGNN